MPHQDNMAHTSGQRDVAHQSAPAEVPNSSVDVSIHDLSIELHEKREKAWTMRAEVMMTRKLYDAELLRLCQAECDAGETAMKCKTDLNRLDLEILQQGSAKTLEQKRKSQQLKKTYQEARKKKEEQQTMRQEQAEQVCSGERRLLEIFLDIQVIEHQCRASAPVPVSTRPELNGPTHVEVSPPSRVVEVAENSVNESSRVITKEEKEEEEEEEEEEVILENASDVRNDPEIAKAIKNILHADEVLEHARNEFTQHFRSYFEQFLEFRFNDEDDTDTEVLEAAFGPIYLERGHIATRKLVSAESGFRNSQKRGREVGVPNVNAEDQESGFFTVRGEGLTNQTDEEIAQTCNRKRIHEWLDSPEKTSKLEPVEARYAFSGAAVETWDSVSSYDRDANKKRKIDTHNAVDGQKKVQFDTGNDRGRKNEPSSNSRRKTRARSLSEGTRSPDGYAGFEFTFSHPHNVLQRTA